MGSFKIFKSPLTDEDGNATPELLAIAEKELGETPGTRQKSVKTLRKLLKGNESLKSRLDDNFLLAFLRTKKFDVPSAYETVKRYYKVRNDYPDIYTNFSPEALQEVYRNNWQIVCPQLHPSGGIVMIIKFGQWDPRVVCPDEALQALILASDHAIRDALVQINGVILIADCKGTAFHHIRAMPPGYIRRRLFLIQDCFPLRVKSTHIVNESPLIDVLFTFARPLLHSKVKERVFFHGNNMESLHKHVPCNMLPLDYGGREDEDFDDSFFFQTLYNSFDAMVQHAAHGYKGSERKGIKIENCV